MNKLLLLLFFIGTIVSNIDAAHAGQPPAIDYKKNAKDEVKNKRINEWLRQKEDDPVNTNRSLSFKDDNQLSAQPGTTAKQ